MAVGFQELLDAADAQVESVSVADMAAAREDDDIVMVDIRDPRELERDGMIPGAFHAPRGMLEFWIDPASPYHKPQFAQGKTYVFYCASGWRSLLSAKLAQDMGLSARSLRGGFAEWKAGDNPTEAPPQRKG